MAGPGGTSLRAFVCPRTPRAVRMRRGSRERAGEGFLARSQRPLGRGHSPREVGRARMLALRFVWIAAISASARARPAPGRPLFAADSEGGALLRPSYRPDVLTARAVHAGGSEAGRSAPGGVRVASDAARSHRNEGSGPVEPWAISRKLDHDDATNSTTSRTPRQRPGSTGSEAGPDHSRAFRRIETRCRVTPKRSAICSIVRPSA
jgi:hypothetical protein